MSYSSSHNLLDHDSGLIRNNFTLNQLTDFARGVLSDSNSDGILDSVASPSRTQAWDLDAMGNWQSLSTNGTGQSRTHNAQNQVTGVGSATLAFDAEGMTNDVPVRYHLIYEGPSNDRGHPENYPDLQKGS
ncbi:hypothetical protein GC170_04060 [bacterium]|nr:hypothetical protein [bacterium]